MRKNNISDAIDIIENKEYKINPIIQKETKKCINYKNFEKLKNNIYKMDLKQVMQTEKEIEILEQYIKSLKKYLVEKNKEFENINNLKLIGGN